MPKSKEFVNSSESASDEESETKSTEKKPKTKGSDNKQDPPAKRAKTTDEENGAAASKSGANGERLYEIGKLRYVSVSEFRGKSYVNIREYYEDKGVEKPGKKGISLTGDQWEKLKSLINQVDKDLKKAK
ncbi:unnamed protein product [Rotaria sp. Silwood1]|nr:unnamed protein product [Rotaria sp. Silwood1]CAF1385568.1 unnamed protein product [Rotaria sp. Silwood1]CAF1387405.1 unnamed protein product [Rotaria sp. Silwood1]CAF3527121.1 unnamed protein product [Rotaria sp. Silwood1]CAF3555924.1 unnamed protein product [Rotaria sp. Silwood1]